MNRQHKAMGLGLAALFAAGLFCAPALAQAAKKPAAAPTQAQLDKNGALILIRSSLLALDQANKTGSYTVLRDIGAPGFQDANTAAKLGDVFANLRRDGVDLSGVAVLEPQLTAIPQVEANRMMRMVGVFPSVPTQIKFEVLYAPVQGQWRLYGVSVAVASATPAAPAAPGEVAAPAAKKPAAPAAAQKR
jgi:hypothetical protein